MLLPISDHPNPRGVPWMTAALVAANVLVFALVTLPMAAQRPDPQDPLLYAYLRAIADTLPPGVALLDVARQTTLYDLFVFQFGFRPAAMSVLTLFTSMFLHGSLLHIAGNMLFLWIYGNNVEHRLGPVGFLAWYLLAGIAATAFQSAFNLGSQIPLIGASGAISGVLGFYFVWFPGHTVRMFAFLFPFFVGTLYVPARIVLAIYLLVDNLLPFLVATGAGGIAHGAHIGGFVAGLAAALVMGRRKVNSEQ